MRTRKSPHSTPAPLPVPMNNGQGGTLPIGTHSTPAPLPVPMNNGQQGAVAGAWAGT